MLKLAKLPDRTPVKLTITVTPDLHRSLADYAVMYAQHYGQKETVTDLIPAMVAGFLDGDRVFQRERGAQKDG